MPAHKLACKECLLLTPTHYHTHSLTVCPLTHSQLVKHSQASHLINLDIFEEVSPPKKRTQIFEALVLVNPFSKINTNLIVGKISLVWKIEVGKHARSGNLRVGKVVESGKLSRENNSLDSCSREKDVAPKKVLTKKVLKVFKNRA